MDEEEWLPIYRSIDGVDLYSVCTTAELLSANGEVIDPGKGFSHPKWAMLCALACRPGDPVSKRELWKVMYGSGYVGDRTDKILKTEKAGLCKILDGICPLPDGDIRWSPEEKARWTLVITSIPSGDNRGYKLNLTPVVGNTFGLPTGGGEHIEGEDEASESAVSTLTLNAQLCEAGIEGGCVCGRHLNAEPVKIDPCENEVVGFGHNFKADGRLTWFGQGSKSHRLAVPSSEGVVSEALGVIGLPEQQLDKSDPKRRATSPISKYHCVAVYNWQEQGWRLFDLNSTNGTMVIRKEPEGAETILIAGLGQENKKDLRTSRAATSPLEAVAIQTGARIGDGSTDYYAGGVPIKRGDKICMAFRIERDEQGVCRLKPRNESCIVEVL